MDSPLSYEIRVPIVLSPHSTNRSESVHGHSSLEENFLEPDRTSSRRASWHFLSHIPFNGVETQKTESPPTERKLSKDLRTVDWRYDDNLYRRQVTILEEYGGEGFLNYIRQTFIKIESWVFAAAIGLLTAICAAYIDVGAQFFADLRIGFCKEMFWLDRSRCCASPAAVDHTTNSCIQSISGSGIDNIDLSHWTSWPSFLIKIPYTSYFYFISVYFMYIVVSCCLAVLAAVLVLVFAPHAAGSGIPEVKTILGGFVMRGVLGGWTLLIKCVGLCLGVGSGLALGKEGPMVHVGCCWSNLLSRFSFKFYNNEAKKRELLSAACAAGVSVAFGAPIGGVLFSLEEVSTYFPPKTLWKSFFCAVIAALALKWIDPSGDGNLTMFQLDSISLSSSWEIIEIIPFALLGLMGGVLGAFFVHLNVRWNAYRRQKSFFLNHPVLEVFIVALFTSLLNFILPMLRGTSSHLLSSLFSRCGSEYADPFKMCKTPSDQNPKIDYRIEFDVVCGLLLVLVFRFIQTTFTFGIGVPAGLFIPCLTIGGALGRLMGLGMIGVNKKFSIMQSQNAIHPGVYALVGACSMLGGVTRMTISLVVIMFELTGGLSYVLPFMVAVMISKWSGDALCRHGIYDCFIQLKGYPFLHDVDTDLTFTSRASDVMESELIVITLRGNTVGSLLRKLVRYPSYGGFPIVTSHKDSFLVGYIPSSLLSESLNTALEDSDISATSVVTFSLYDGLLASQAREKEYTPKLKLQPDSCATHSVRAINPTKGGGKGFHLRIAKDLMKYGEVTGNTLDLSEIVDEHIIQLVPETPLAQISNIFRQLGLKFCLLTRHGRLEGLLTKKQFLAHLQNTPPSASVPLLPGFIA